MVRWNLGNGATSNLTDPSVAFGTPGNATVSVTVSDAVGATAAGKLVLEVETPSNATGSGGSPGPDVPGMVASLGIVVGGAVLAAVVWVVRRGRLASA